MSESGWFKLNTNEAYSSGGSKSTCGGVVRNFEGDWIGGFSLQTEAKDILNVELAGI